jgi:hypothetical protein
MRRANTGFRYMHRTDWGWLAAKTVTGVILPLTLFLNMPISVRNGTVSGYVVVALLGLMLLGGLLSITGILLRGTQVRPLIVGYAIEMGGILALILSLAILAAVYGISAVNEGSSITAPVLCLAIAAPFVARGLDVMFYHLAPKKGVDPNAQTAPKGGD